MTPKPSLVVALIALIAALAGTAYAAVGIDSADIKNGSLKSADFKNNAGVKGADVVNGSIAGADVGDGSVAGADIADDSLNGADVNEGALAISRLTAQIGGDSGATINAGLAPLAVPNLSYTQAADSTDRYVAGGVVSFAASCSIPRSATGYLLIDGLVPTGDNIVGTWTVTDSAAGAVTRSFTVAPVAGPGGPGTSQFRRETATPHAFVFYGSRTCSAGSGVTLSSAGIDVISHR